MFMMVMCRCVAVLYVSEVLSKQCSCIDPEMADISFLCQSYIINTALECGEQA